MSKSFLKKIGFVALLIFVSHIIPPSADAMMRYALWRDYDENQNLRNYVQCNATDIGKRALADREKSIYRLEHRWKALQVRESYAWSQKWFVCDKEPLSHPPQFILDISDEHGYTSKEKPKCEECALGGQHDNDC
jgi:hypothetical protein